MKKQDIKKCFSKIKPSEELISDTLCKIEREREKSERGVFSLGFSYRLASAVCALVLVLGLSAAVAMNPGMIPRGGDEEGGAENVSLVSGRTAEDGTNDTSAMCADVSVISDMTDRAKTDGGDYAVFYGSLDGCYFGGVTLEEAQDGVMYRCTLTFTLGADEVRSSEGASLPWIGEGGALEADVYIYDHDTIDLILNSGYAYVRLSRIGDTWTVAEFVPVSAE